MTTLIILLIVLLIGIVAVQIGKVTELSGKILGEEESEKRANNFHGLMSLWFMIGFLVFCVVSTAFYKNWMLGYGPHKSASAHGFELDSLFNVTTFFTAIVFVLTQVALFWFAYKYKADPNRKSIFLAHNNTIEVVWTVIPAVVMCFLVIRGLVAWNEVMADVPEGEDHIEIEAMGVQFNWLLRYPGPDGLLGERYYKRITGLNPFGQNWNDDKNLDDFQPSEIVLPVNKKVRVRITSRDVLHNFDLPHFRVKMDAVPGMPTYFVFTPTTTTAEYRQQLREYDEYHALSDPEDPESPPLWEAFDFELACAELCGTGHFSMRRIVRIVSEEEYEKWLTTQKSYYMQNIRNSDEDPNKGKLLDLEIRQRSQDFSKAIEVARTAEDEAGKILPLQYVKFKTGSADLTANSSYELDNVVTALKKYASMQIEVAGHTDNVGDPVSNKTLSDARATAVYNYLTTNGIVAERITPVGYGDTMPKGDNATPEGRKENRRTEIKILSN